MNALFHITSRAEANHAQRAGDYVSAGYEAEGFIHCSYAHQVTAVADQRFKGRMDLVLLEIDRSLLDADVFDENLEGGTELFPHLYGTLPWSAVRRVHDFPCRSDGTFELPPGHG